MTEWHPDRARTEPVTSGCLWCKCETPEAVRIPVGDQGEYLCPVCLGDLRWFKRHQLVELFYDTSLEPTIKRIITDHWDAARAELLRVHAADPDLVPLPRRKANAHDHDPLRYAPDS